MLKPFLLLIVCCLVSSKYLLVETEDKDLDESEEVADDYKETGSDYSLDINSGKDCILVNRKSKSKSK